MKEQEGQLAELFTRYQTIFSQNYQDVGITELVHHSINTLEGTHLIPQLPHSLRAQKEQETEHQVQNLFAQVLIEPENGAWGSPVILVRKNDQSWCFCMYYRKLYAVTLQNMYPPTLH